jgi:NAD(P)-dependent dehydrogenase (short-subunit alcohol dehydrogenase family)
MGEGGAENVMDAPDEVVVVFGGTSGIGEAVARKMLTRGSAVVITGRDPDRLAGAARRLGGAVRTAEVDASDRDAVDAFFDSLGLAVDHLVLSFSTGRAGGPFRDLPMTELGAAVAGKLVAYLSVLQAALARLRTDGSVTFIGAASAGAALPATAGLAAVNGGLDAAVRPLAVELAPLRVNVVAPGVIETPWWAGMPEPVREGVFARATTAPAGRTGTPDDVAAAVALLIDSSYVTGTVLPCDGGLRLS